MFFLYRHRPHVTDSLPLCGQLLFYCSQLGNGWQREVRLNLGQAKGTILFTVLGSNDRSEFMATQTIHHTQNIPKLFKDLASGGILESKKPALYMFINFYSCGSPHVTWAIHFSWGVAKVNPAIGSYHWYVHSTSCQSLIISKSCQLKSQ